MDSYKKYFILFGVFIACFVFVNFAHAETIVDQDAGLPWTSPYHNDDVTAGTYGQGFLLSATSSITKVSTIIYDAGACSGSHTVQIILNSVSSTPVSNPGDELQYMVGSSTVVTGSQICSLPGYVANETYVDFTFPVSVTLGPGQYYFTIKRNGSEWYWISNNLNGTGHNSYGAPAGSVSWLNATHFFYVYSSGSAPGAVVSMAYPVATTTAGNFSSWNIDYSFSDYYASNTALMGGVTYSDHADFSQNTYTDGDWIVFSSTTIRWAFAHSVPLSFGTWYAYAWVRDGQFGPTIADVASSSIINFQISATGTTPWDNVINSTSSIPILASSSWSGAFDSLCVAATSSIFSDFGGNLGYGLCRAGLFLVAPHNFSLQFIQNSFNNFKQVFPFNLLFGVLDIEKNQLQNIQQTDLTEIVTWPDNTTSSITYLDANTLVTIFGFDNANWIYNFILMLMIVALIWNAKSIIL